MEERKSYRSGKDRKRGEEKKGKGTLAS